MRRSTAAVIGTAAALVLAPLTHGADAVVGGKTAKPGQFPFMASVQDDTGFAFCGGSVVSRSWVLTAAHCVEDGDASDLYVVTGTNDLSSGGQRSKVDKVVVNPAYANSAHDTALLHLASPTSSPAITLASAADDDLERAGTKVTVAGWGDTLPTLGLMATNTLLYADLSVVSDVDCGDANVGFDAATGMCAEALLKDSCQGDSGGPLFATKAGRTVQVGVVSYGTSCAVPGFPGVYSEVNNSQIRSWIAATAGV